MSTTLLIPYAMFLVVVFCGDRRPSLFAVPVESSSLESSP